ncbi:MAG: hypothetical protein ABIO63_13255 [Casimicrobiaceae bacterium]
MGARWWHHAALVLLAGAAMHAPAAPPAPERVMALCAEVESPGHCGRKIEAEQLKSLPSLAVRDGDTLKISLFPSGHKDLVDVIVGAGARSYALWDYWSNANAVVLFISEGDRLSYGVLQRANGLLATVPAEPVLSPDRQNLAVADFCPAGCTNQLTVWRVARDGIRKTAAWSPPVPWSDVTVSWKDAETLALQYTPAGAAAGTTVNRALNAADWQRVEAPR